jgi:hypothetical protein
VAQAETYTLYLAAEDVTYDAILPCPERISVAWHRQAKGINQLLDGEGRGSYGIRPSPEFWRVREYVRKEHYGPWASYLPASEGTQP